MKILNHQQIDQKLKRIAYEILENNYKTKKLCFLGINDNGYAFAKLLQDQYDLAGNKESILGRIKLNPASPIETEVSLEVDDKSLNNKHIIIVDDVANTGRTLFYALTPIMKYLPKKVEVAVLVDRKHKTFPINADYVGLSLATTLDENIKVDIKKESSRAAFLQ